MRCNISYSYYYHLLLLLLLSLSYYAYAYTTQSRNHLHINAAVDKLIFLFTHEPIFQSRVYFACTDSISGTDIPPKRPPPKKNIKLWCFFLHWQPPLGVQISTTSHSSPLIVPTVARWPCNSKIKSLCLVLLNI